MKVLLPEKVHKALKKYSVDLGKTMPSIAVEAIKTYLEAKGRYKEEK